MSGRPKEARAPERITSPLLGVPHAFLTRRGGVSTGLYASLNAGRGSRDDPEAVAENRARAARALGAEPRALVTAHQTHSARAAIVAEWSPASGPAPRADALATSHPGLVLGVLSADCAPVLLADARAGVVGAAHAGWRGAVGGVVEAVVEAMAALGARRERIAAAVGPCIGPSIYEVGPDFEAAVTEADPEAARFVRRGEGGGEGGGEAGGRARFDLPGYALHRLARAGVARAAWTGHCTYADPARFFSYRRSAHRGEPDYGRLISVLRAPAPR